MPQKHFFEWCNETITYPTIQNIRKHVKPLTIEEAQEGSIPSDQEVCMWGDSDILYLQQMTSPKRIKAIISRDVSFTKIVTKINSPVKRDYKAFTSIHMPIKNVYKNV